MGKEMNNLSMCRICLSTDVRLCPIAKHLQYVYDKLTGLKFKREDRRPQVVCYICHARLRNCFELTTNCLRGDELLTQMLSSGVLIQVTSTNSLRAVSVLQFSLGHVLQKNTKCHVKELAMQTIDDTKLKQQCTKDIEKENQEHSAQKDKYTQILKTLSEHSETSNDLIKSETDDVEADAEHVKYRTDISIDENGWEPYNTSPCSHLVNNIICPKIVKIVLERTNIHTKIGAPYLNESRLAMQITKETTRRKLDRIEQAKVKIAEPESEDNTLIIDKPIVISKIHKTIGKVNATPKELKYNKVRKARDKVRKQTYNNNGLNKKGLKAKPNVKSEKHTHTAEKRFQCNVCNKYFTFNFQLKIHTRSHTGDKPFSCDTCKKGFSTKTGLIEHIRTHTGEKPYMCDMCNKCFRNHRILKSHKRIHTGEKPYKCNTCNKCFTQQSSLTVHIRTHSSDKPYSCDVCKKSFKYRPVLKGHMRTHTLDKVSL